MLPYPLAAGLLAARSRARLSQKRSFSRIRIIPISGR